MFGGRDRRKYTKGNASPGMCKYLTKTCIRTESKDIAEIQKFIFDNIMKYVLKDIRDVYLLRLRVKNKH